jgi:hypothetical protein
VWARLLGELGEFLQDQGVRIKGCPLQLSPHDFDLLAVGEDL